MFLTVVSSDVGSEVSAALIEVLILCLQLVADMIIECLKAILPYAIPVLGVILVIDIGIAIFKKITVSEFDHVDYNYLPEEYDDWDDWLDDVGWF